MDSLSPDVHENLILYDWVTISSKIHSVENFIAMLGLNKSGIHFEELSGRYGYLRRLSFGNIHILYGGSDDMGVCLEMSGQGCRQFETFGNGDYEALFAEVFDNPADMKVTRLDVAFDDHTGVIDIQRLCDDTRLGFYVSRFTKARTIYGTDGNSIEHGSMYSEIFIRIYDKARERGFDESVHWIRVELQLRRERAMNFLREASDIGDRFCGVLLNYLRYVEPDELDSNRWRWPMKDYWADLLGAAVKITLYDRPGSEYNIGNLDNYVFRQAGNAIDTAIKIYGFDGFLKKLKERGTLPNAKYKRLLELADLFDEEE